MMIEEAKYAAVYGILMLGLIVEILIAVDGGALGSLAGPAILAIASLQAIFIFLVYMHGRYGPRPVAVFAVISLITVVPLFIALLYSVVMPHHHGEKQCDEQRNDGYERNDREDRDGTRAVSPMHVHEKNENCLKRCDGQDRGPGERPQRAPVNRDQDLDD